MARMRRINIVIYVQLDGTLASSAEAAARGQSKSALVRDCVTVGLSVPRSTTGFAACRSSMPESLATRRNHDEIIYG